MQIGIISGTGPQGKGIALRWALAGRTIILGSRSKEKAIAVANELNVTAKSSYIIGQTNEDMIKNSQVILLTVPFKHAAETVRSYVNLLKNYCKIFVDVTVPMIHEKGKGMVPLTISEAKSSTQMFQTMLSPIPVVGAFKTIGAHVLLNISEPINRDTFVIGPLKQRQIIIELISEIENVGLRPLNAGPTREAQTIERLVPFLLNLNRRYKVKDSGIIISGI